MLPIISIIVPVYKVENYLQECMDSLLCQTFSEIEIILVDDGSPDRCGIICEQYARMDERIRVIHQENRGLSYARNQGVKLAQGQYICFVDSDDSVAENYCEDLYHLLDGTEYDFSVCAVQRYQDGEDIPVERLEEKIQILSNREFLKAQLDKKTEFGVWNKLYRRELFDRLSFMNGKLHEDVIWSADLAKSLKNGVIMTSKKLYYYRQRNNGIVGAGKEKCSPDRIFAGEYLADIAEQIYPEIFERALKYAVEYPWLFVDPIYVKYKILTNRQFLKTLQKLIRKYENHYLTMDEIDKIVRRRMFLFEKSIILYGFNAYARLLRVYWFRILRKNPYMDGHGI